MEFWGHGGGNAFWNFRRQGGVKTWKPSVVGYGYFLELPNGTVSHQMPWAGNIAKTITSNGKQFTVTHEMLTTVARDGWNLSTVFKFCFCFVLLYTGNKSLILMAGPLGNSEFCFPRISMFPSSSSQETLRFSGNKIHCSLRDQSLSVKCFWVMFTCQMFLLDID